MENLRKLLKGKAWKAFFCAILLLTFAQRIVFQKMDDRGPNLESDYGKTVLTWHFDAIKQPTALLRIPFLLPRFDQSRWGWGSYGGSYPSLNATDYLSLSFPVYLEGTMNRGQSTNFFIALNGFFFLIDLIYLFGLSALAAYVWTNGNTIAKRWCVVVLVLLYTPFMYLVSSMLLRLYVS